MTRWLRPCLVPFAAVVLSAVGAGGAVAQVTVDDRIASLQELVKKKSDDQATVVVDGLAQAWGGMNEDEKKKSIAALEKCLSARREEGDDKLYEGVIAAFANCGELGQKATLKSLKSANVDKRPGVLAGALRSLGFHKNPANVKALVDYLVHNEPRVVAGAAEALGNYADEPEKTRKPIVEELVKNYAQFSSAASNSGASNKEKGMALERLAVVEKSFRESLQKLTGQEFKDAPAAQKWFNDHKSKKWPDLNAATGGS
ncbi:MAG: HEAT repeat domain-containing protein [Planctomycetes bacterium]|nr:HEAT repeat domain-containing protein [Planctomycetota bacterium]